MNPDKWPWREISSENREALWAAGLTDVREVNELTDKQLLRIEGIDRQGLKNLREVFLGPTGPRSKRGDVLLPSPSGVGYMAPPGPSNRGGPGRPSNELRAQFRAILDMTQEEQIDRLTGTRDAGVSDLSDKELRHLMDVAAKYGIGSRHVLGMDRDQVADLMRELGAIVRMHVLDVSIGSREEILRRIERDWRRVGRVGEEA